MYYFSILQTVVRSKYFLTMHILSSIFVLGTSLIFMLIIIHSDPGHYYKQTLLTPEVSISTYAFDSTLVLIFSWDCITKIILRFPIIDIFPYLPTNPWIKFGSIGYACSTISQVWLFWRGDTFWKYHCLKFRATTLKYQKNDCIKLKFA